MPNQCKPFLCQTRSPVSTNAIALLALLEKTKNYENQQYVTGGESLMKRPMLTDLRVLRVRGGFYEIFSTIRPLLNLNEHENPPHSQRVINQDFY